jgi:LacI family transcriptional regulator
MPQKRVLLTMGSHYIERIHHGVASYAGQNNWHLTNLFGDSPSLIQNRECDGIIAAMDIDDPLSETIIRRRVPTVDLSIIRQNLKMPHLTGDNFAIGRDAALHFLERGFRDFLWFTERNHTASSQRMRGFQAELNAAGFDCTKLVVDEAFPTGKPSWKTLKRWILQTAHALTKPCAVFAYNDIQAVNLLDACVAGGIRVPDEIAVLGTDNHLLICPTAAVPLSSMNHDLEEMGRRAAEELALLMDGAPMERKIIKVPHKGITVRRSTDVFAINDAHVVCALRFLHANYQRSIGVADIVEATGIPRRSLERRFQSSLEKSIHAQLKHIRLDNACRLLKETSYSIADIATACGFNTPEYLHRVFLKQIGMTPRNYRQEAPV